MNRDDFLFWPLFGGWGSSLLFSDMWPGHIVLVFIPGALFGLGLAWYARYNHRKLFSQCPECGGTGEVPRQ